MYLIKQLLNASTDAYEANDFMIIVSHDDVIK